MRTTNRKVINSMKQFIRNNICYDDFKRYTTEHRFSYDYDLYTYGVLDCYDYDLYKRLVEFGVDTKAVTEYSKVLDWGCTYRHRENIRNTYVNLVRNASDSLLQDIRNNKITEKDFKQ